MKFSFINLGCKINQIEMEQASQGLVTLGYEYTEDATHSDFLLINTCTVTTKADRKSLQSIKKYSRWEQVKHVFVTGCYSELEPELASKVHPKNTIVAQRDKRQMPEIIDSLLKEKYGEGCLTTSPISPESQLTPATYVDHSALEDRFSAFKLARVSPDSLKNEQVDFFKHTRAFLKIQDGCNAFCSYCRIPYARGAPVSRSRSDILAHLDRLRLSGVLEVVLSGINIGKYRDSETQASFSQLLRDILERAGDIRVKISSIEPFSLDEDFFDLISHPNLAPHIHLPLQGLSDDILKRMNRRYRLSDYRDIVERIYRVRPDFSIATDVIVGYPGESDAVYETGKDFLWECGISNIHVFPFSPRPFTDDFLQGKTGGKTEETMKAVDEATKKHRSRNLREFSKRLESCFLDKVKSREQKIILESRVESPTSSNSKTPTSQIGSTSVWYQGTTEYNLKGMVCLDSESPIPELSDHDKDMFKGKCLTVKMNQVYPLIFCRVVG